MIRRTPPMCFLFGTGCARGYACLSALWTLGLCLVAGLLRRAAPQQVHKTATDAAKKLVEKRPLFERQIAKQRFMEGAAPADCRPVTRPAFLGQEKNGRATV